MFGININSGPYDIFEIVYKRKQEMAKIVSFQKLYPGCYF